MCFRGKTTLGTTAQFGGASGDVFSAICIMQISRFTASKPSKFAFASDEKSIRQPTTSFVRCYLILFPAFACAICLRREFGNSIKKAGARSFELHAPALCMQIMELVVVPYLRFPPNRPVIPPRIPRVTCRVTSRVAVLIAVFCTRPSTESFFRARAARSSRSSSACFRRSSA